MRSSFLIDELFLEARAEIIQKIVGYFEELKARKNAFEIFRPVDCGSMTYWCWLRYGFFDDNLTFRIKGGLTSEGGNFNLIPNLLKNVCKWMFLNFSIQTLNVSNWTPMD